MNRFARTYGAGVVEKRRNEFAVTDELLEKVRKHSEAKAETKSKSKENEAKQKREDSILILRIKIQ